MPKIQQRQNGLASPEKVSDFLEGQRCAQHTKLSHPSFNVVLARL